MSQENFWILFSKKVAGEASPGELAELEKLIQQHPEWQYAVQNLQDIWNTIPTHDTSSAEDAYLLHLQRMKEKGIPMDDNDHKVLRPANSKRRTLKYVLYSSAAVAACLLIGFIFLIKPQGDIQSPITFKEVSEVSTRPGSKSRIQLPDGSIVWINSGSKLTYNKDFGKDVREVHLSGEAFFDVVKDKEHPFLIHTNTIDIKVLGTAFNVKAYPGDKTTETSLIRGLIEVSIKSRPDDKVVLSPNEKLVIANKSLADSAARGSEEERLMVINKLKRDRTDSSVLETKWTENKLVFDDEPLEDIALKMERWFNVEIEISDPILSGKRLTGKFENESIEQALEGLAYTSTVSFVFERKGNKIFIHRK